jgi:putative membrane protein
MKTKHLSIVALLVFCIFQSCQSNHNPIANEQSTDSTVMKDAVTDTSGINRGADYPVFIKEATMTGIKELSLSQAALEKANSPQVKDFAKKIIADQTKISDGLKSLAAEKKITLTTTLPASDLAHIEEMKKMPGADFDKHYMGMMVKSQISNLDLFKSASTLGDTPSRNFAAKMLSRLEAQYKMGTDIKEKLN